MRQLKNEEMRLAPSSEDRGKFTESCVRDLFVGETLGVARIAPDGQFTNVNSAFSRMLGYDKPQLLRKTWDEITHPHDLAHETILLKGITGGPDTSYKVEKRYVCGNGSYLWVTETSSAVNDADKNLLYRISLIQINASKQAVEHLRSALEAAQNAVLLLDSKGRIALSNASAERLLGYSSEKLVGKCVSCLADTAFRKRRFKKLLQRATQEANPPSFEMRFRTENGISLGADVHLAPMYTPAGTWVLMSLVNIQRAQHKGQSSAITIFKQSALPSAPHKVTPAYRLRRAVSKNH